MTDLTSIMQCHEADFRVVVPRCALVLPAFTNGITVFTTCTGMITLSSFRIVPRAAMRTTTLSFDRDSHCHHWSKFHCCTYTVLSSSWRKNSRPSQLTCFTILRVIAAVAASNTKFKNWLTGHLLIAQTHISPTQILQSRTEQRYRRAL